MKFRPWGTINWALSLSSKKDWQFIGALGTEERSICSWELLTNAGQLSGSLLAKIHDVDGDKYRAENLAAYSLRLSEFQQKGGSLSDIKEMDLMSELYRILKFYHGAKKGADSIILDITSLPKRFFFPMLKNLLADQSVRNLLLTYTAPKSYADGALYEDVDKWKNIPGFGGERNEREDIIVSIGFLVESLKRYFVDEPQHGQVKLLVPFPAPLSVLRRTWESVANLEGEAGNRFEKYRIETLDMSDAFDRIKSLDEGSSYSSAFAPFGPKPTAAAMCVFASQKNSAVYYPQPTVYHPDYSKGIRNDDPEIAVTAYWVKHEGENFYSL